MRASTFSISAVPSTRLHTAYAPIDPSIVASPKSSDPASKVVAAGKDPEAPATPLTRNA
jgi:hypothetical protein